MAGQGEELVQALQQSWKFISNTELMHPVDDASKCVVCFVTKQCCRAILDQKILQMTAEDAQTLKYSVCKDHSSKAGHVEFAMSVIDLYMKGLK